MWQDDEKERNKSWSSRCEPFGIFFPHHSHRLITSRLAAWAAVAARRRFSENPRTSFSLTAVRGISNACSGRMELQSVRLMIGENKPSTRGTTRNTQTTSMFELLLARATGGEEHVATVGYGKQIEEIRAGHRYCTIEYVT